MSSLRKARGQEGHLVSDGLCAHVWPPPCALGHCVLGPITPLCCCHSIPLAVARKPLKTMITVLMIQKLVMEGIRVDRVIVFASLLGMVQERKYNDAEWIEGTPCSVCNSVME